MSISQFSRFVTMKDVGIEEEFDGEDGEEPWGIDEYTAEGYAPPCAAG